MTPLTQAVIIFMGLFFHPCVWIAFISGFLFIMFAFDSWLVYSSCMICMDSSGEGIIDLV